MKYNTFMDYYANMVNKNYGVYLKYDYLMFPISLSIVREILVEDKMFFSKRNYHVSLICLKNIPKKEQIKIFDFAQKFKLKLGKIKNTFQLATDGDQKTIIVRVKILGLKRLISGINKYFGYSFGYPPTHITLLTLKEQTGIGIDTFKRYRQICTKVSTDDVKRLVKSFKFI